MLRGWAVVPTLARRFLLSKTSDGFLSLISWVSVLGVSLGVLALVVVTSVINGFEGELARVITGMNGEVLFYSRGEPLIDAAGLEEKLKKIVPETKAITASFVTELMASGPHGVAGAVLEGIDSATVGFVTEIPRRVVEGRLPGAAGPQGEVPVADGRIEVAVGSAIAERIGAKVGEEIRLIAPFIGEAGGEGAEPEAGSGRVLAARVVGIVRMGLYEYDSKFVFAKVSDVQQALGFPNRVTSFKMRLMPGADPRQVSDRLGENFGYPFRSKDWSQLNKNLLYAIQLEKVVISIALTLIILVAAFNVVSTLMMMIYDKTKEIAILKAMGFKPSQSFQLFVLIGTGIGLVGTLLGVVLGLGVNAILARTRLIDLPADIYYIDFLPVAVRRWEIAVIAGVALLITFVASLFPAYQVSNRPPLEGLRYE